MIVPRLHRGVLLLVVYIATGIAGLSAFSLQEALDRIGSTSTVRAAQSALDAAQANLRKSSYAGDFSLTASPQAKATTEFAVPFPEQTVVNGTIAAKLPVGLSDAQKLQVTQAEAAVQTARERLAQAKESAYELVYGLYMQAWLAEQVQGVLKAELAAAQAYSAALEEQFRAGKVSFVELTTADEDLRTKEAAASKGELERRLSWLRLTTAVGIPYTSETPTLAPDPGLSQSLDLPSPPELVAWAMQQDAAVQSIERDLAGIREQIDLLRQPDLSSSVQLLGGVADHGFSLSYTFDQPQLGASYTIPFYTKGTIPGNNSANLTDTWNVGLAVSFVLSGGKEKALETAALGVQRDQQDINLEERRNELQLDIRSRYQEWLTSTDNISLAEAVLERARSNGAIVDSRRSLGLASDYELLQSQAATARAEYALQAARSVARMKFLAAANSATYLSKLASSFENGGKR